MSILSRTVIPALVVLTPVLNQLSRTDDIPSPEQRSNVHVQRAVHFGTAQQHPHRSHALEHRVRRRPRILQQVEADLPVVERDVRVDD